MNDNELEMIRQWDRRCGNNECTFFPVTIDRRRLLEYVDELKAALDWAVSTMKERGEIKVADAPLRVAPILEESRRRAGRPTSLPSQFETGTPRIGCA